MDFSILILERTIATDGKTQREEVHEGKPVKNGKNPYVQIP